MNHKVLLADDSLTIQKVIKITLANQPYDITDCSTEDELFQKLPAVRPRIVFLDFNLSEKYTGYELTSKIKAISPATKVLLLLGTFDNVDDGALQKCGASDKIVKPFDSNKFIAICKELSRDSEEDGSGSGANDELDRTDEVKASAVAEEPLDQWQMNSSAQRIEDPSDTESTSTSESGPDSKLDALALEISDWGMSIPNVIDADTVQEIRVDLPPIISPAVKTNTKESLPSTSEKPEYKPFEIKFPETDDLDYPTIEELQNAPAAVPEARPRPQLISIDDFDNKEQEVDMQGDVEQSTDVQSIEAQIRDEVEDNLWQADEFEELKQEVSAKIDQLKNEFEPTGDIFDETQFVRLDENDPKIEYTSPETPAATAPFDMDSVRTEMETMVKRYVHEYMDQMFKSSVEKITWEVIPDLAENLIRQELNKIANKILNDQN